MLRRQLRQLVKATAHYVSIPADSIHGVDATSCAPKVGAQGEELEVEIRHLDP